jgi:hypothetical protein
MSRRAAAWSVQPASVVRQLSAPVPPAGALAGAGAALRTQAQFTGKIRYYARLLVNGHVVGTSGLASLGEDFTVAFRDLFRCGA